MVTLTLVVVADFVVGAGVAALLAHPVHAHPVRAALVSAAADGLADTLLKSVYNI